MPMTCTMTEDEYEADQPKPLKCEFCPATEGLLDDHGVLSCLPCCLATVSEYEPKLVAMMGQVVARASKAATHA